MERFWVKRRTVSAVFALFFLAGCASDTEIDFSVPPVRQKADGALADTELERCPTAENVAIKPANHILSMDKMGRYQPVTIRPVCAGKPLGPPLAQPLPQDFPAERCGSHSPEECKIDRAFDAHADAVIKDLLSRNTPQHLFVFIHGGLNPFESSLKRAARDMAPIMAYRGPKVMDPADRRPDERYFPLFVVWPSGLFDTYGDQTFKYAQGEYSPTYKSATSPLYIAADIGETVARAPTGIAKSIRRFSRSQTKRSKTIGQYLGCKPGIGPSYICNQGGKPLNRSGEWAGYYATTPFRILSVPLIDAMAKEAWDNMVARTRMAFERPFRRSRQIEVGEDYDWAKPYRETGDNGKGTVWRFFSKLEQKLATHEGPPVRITLVGHSMGAFIVNQIVNAFPNLEYKNIVYMAAAASIREFRLMTEPVVKLKKDTRVFSLSLHPLAEGTEINWGGISPIGSLLEWIDDIYTTPYTMEDRTMGKWENVVVAQESFSDGIQDRMRFKRFDRTCAGPTRHGGFGFIPDPEDMHVIEADGEDRRTFCKGEEESGAKGWYERRPYWDARFWYAKDKLCSAANPGDCP